MAEGSEGLELLSEEEEARLLGEAKDGRAAGGKVGSSNNYICF